MTEETARPTGDKPSLNRDCVRLSWQLRRSRGGAAKSVSWQRPDRLASREPADCFHRLQAHVTPLIPTDWHVSACTHGWANPCLCTADSGSKKFMIALFLRTKWSLNTFQHGKLFKNGNSCKPYFFAGIISSSRCNLWKT